MTTTSVGTLPAPHSAGEAELASLLEMIYSERRWDFRGYKSTSLKRRIYKRLLDMGVKSYGEYMEVLAGDPSEYANLFSALTVKVSEFFRDPPTFNLIKDHMDGLGRAGGLRAWCCGCARGEEAYSLAILLWEALGKEGAALSKVFATDLDRSALETARRAVYREDFLGNVSPERIQRHFLYTDGMYKVMYDLRNIVTFGVLDLVRDRAFSRIDILLCRNLFIYFKKTLQEEVFEKLDFALAPGGLLVLGKAEVVPAPFAHRYEAVRSGLGVYRKRV